LSAATAAAAPATATAMASFLRKKRNIRLVATASGNSSSASKIKGEQEEKGEDSNATTAARQDSNVKKNKENVANQPAATDSTRIVNGNCSDTPKTSGVVI